MPPNQYLQYISAGKIILIKLKKTFVILDLFIFFDYLKNMGGNPKNYLIEYLK